MTTTSKTKSNTTAPKADPKKKIIEGKLKDGTPFKRIDN